MFKDNPLFDNIFGSLKDHRINRTRRHPMENILFISMCAVISGAETWIEIEDFGNAKIDWFAQHLDMPNGIPSHDTFNRFFSALNPDVFELCFRRWISSMIPDMKEQVISIDGKTIRGSREYKKSPIHMVSAWSSAHGLTLGQMKTFDKSNEITVIPELLDALSIKGSIITIDAMGCQTDIVDKIVERKANYVLAVKGNQKTLHTDLQLTFDHLAISSLHETNDVGHGRIEKRVCSVSKNLDLLVSIGSWKDAQAVAKIESTVYTKVRGRTERSTRYYITNLDTDAETISRIVRSHWGVENNLHWMLDVAFHEDDNRKKNRNAVVNFSLISKIAMMIIKKDASSKVGMKSKRLKCGWDNSYLDRILNVKF